MTTVGVAGASSFGGRGGAATPFCGVGAGEGEAAALRVRGAILFSVFTVWFFGGNVRLWPSAI